MSFFRPLAAAALSAAVLLPAAAFADPAAERAELMKQVGAAMKTLGGTAKGAEYDAAAVSAAFGSMHEAALAFGSKFPEGSMTEKSEAGPAIWTDPEGFEKAVAKFVADTEAAVAAAPADKDAFMPVFAMVAANCKACHSDYRVKK